MGDFNDPVQSAMKCMKSSFTNVSGQWNIWSIIEVETVAYKQQCQLINNPIGWHPIILEWDDQRNQQLVSVKHDDKSIESKDT